MRLSLIVAIDKYGGIGKNGVLPWKITDEIKHFYDVTAGSNKAVIMGKNTFLSIPVKHRPLKNRLNIVVSSTLEPLDDVIIVSNLQDALNHCSNNAIDCAYISGGVQLYQEALHHKDLSELWISHINDDYDCDTFFPFTGKAINMPLDTDSIICNEFLCWTKNKTVEVTYLRFTEPAFQYMFNGTLVNDTEIVSYKHNVLNSFRDNSHDEYQYLDLLSLILNTGDTRPTRNAECLSVFAPPEMKFNLLNGFPLLTTKRTFWKGIVLELLMFLKGSTDAFELNKNGVNIWDLNTTREFLDNRKLFNYKEGDMGPMYGWQFRHFGADYKGKDFDYTNCGFDQLAEVIRLLKEDKNSRRIMMTSYDPSKVSESVLPPCHSLVLQFYVNGSYLDCKMYQRSADMFLGVPFNIASTSLLLHILATATGFTPRFVTITLGDAHIYSGHIQQVKKQLTRLPMQFPTISIKKQLSHPSVSNILENIEHLQFDDFVLNNYRCHKGIKAEMYP